MSDPYAPASLILGREAELETLRAESAAAMRGAGRVVLLVGEAGIGKTTLASAHGAEAAARGALVTWGRCQDLPGAPAYWPWIQVLDGLERAGIAGYESDLETLRALMPELRAESTTVARSVDEHARFELFARVADTLTRLSEKQGLVIVIDDLHSADASSRRLLQFLASELTQTPILIVATMRDHEPVTGELMEEFARVARHIPIGPLQPSAIAQLLEERLPRLADASASVSRGDRAELARELWERGNGNPFFVLEIGHLLMMQPQEAGPRQALPAGVKAVVEKRLRPFTGDGRAVLEAAATIGRAFDLSRLRRVTGRDADAIYDILDSAIDLGLIVKQRDTPNRFAFAHALTQETLYESLGRRETSALHARVGNAIETEYEAHPREILLAELAHHFFEAVEAIGHESFVRYALDAGHRALDQFAYDEAALYFERVVKALAKSGDAQTHIRAQTALAQAVLGMGERERAEALGREARDLAKKEGLMDLFGEALLCWCAAREEIGVVDSETNDAIEAALPILEGSAGLAIRARLTACLASGLYRVPGSEARQRTLNDAAAHLAEQTGDPGVIGFVQFRRMPMLLGPDHLQERLEFIDEMLETAGDRPIPALHALTFLVDARAELCDRNGLDHALARFQQKAKQLRHPYFLWTGDTFRAAIALLEGRFEEAETSARSALEWGVRAQQRTPGLHFAQQMFMLRGWQNRLEEVAPLVEGSVETAEVVPAWRCALADLYCRLGRVDEARAEFEAVAVDDFASLPNDTTWLTSLVLLSSVCVQLGDRARAETLYRLIAPYAGQVCITTPLVVLVHTIDSRLGILAMLLGRHEDAERHLEAALLEAERMRSRTWLAEVQFYRAQFFFGRNQAGDPALAEEAIGIAESVARSIGMELLLEWVRALRESSNASPAGLPSIDTPAPLAEFTREGDLWSLRFQGRTTRLGALAGLGHLHRLLSSPGIEIHALDLVAGAQGHSERVPHGDSGEAIDERSRSQYRKRLRELDEALAEADQMNDRGRMERMSEERESLMAELARGFGLGGKVRRAGSAPERARVSVTRAIKYAIRKIEEHDVALAQILARDIRTGTFCSYAPVDNDRIQWSL